MRLMSRLPVVFLLPLLLFVSACDSNENKEEVVVTDLEVGTGLKVENFQTLIVEYTGRFTDGSTFDSSDEKGEPFIFTLGIGQVIKGWDRGLVDMRVGGTRRLEIPSHLAFGKNGQCFSNGECAVPGNTPVVYDVTVIDVFDEVLVTDTVVGEGLTAEIGDVLVVEYIGQISDENGEVFDASAVSGGNYLFRLGTGAVIQGWDLGLSGMKQGGTRLLKIPPMFGYGGYGIPGKIPPFAVLYFKIQLVEVVKRPTG